MARMLEPGRLRAAARSRHRHPAHHSPLPEVERTDISVVVPVYNEAKNLPILYEEICEALQVQSWELILIDDGSTDSSHQVAAAIHQRDNRVRVVRLRRNFGKTAALSAGMSVARGDVIVIMDGDLQDDPKEIPGLLRALDSGIDMVCGWRRPRRDSISKRLSSFAFNKMVSYVTGVPLHDMNCGLKAFRSQVAREIKLYGDLHRYLPVLAAQRGFKIGELEVNHRPRLHGRSKYGFSRAAASFLDIQTVMFLTRYLGRPLRLFGTAGMVLLAAGIVAGLYLSALHFAGTDIYNRPLLNLSVLLVISGLQLFSVGLIGEMIQNVAFTKEREYSVESVLLTQGGPAAQTTEVGLNE